jgi:tetratricopeptide (TPR) repeat protein
LGWLRTAAWYVWILPDFVLRFVVQWWSTRPWSSLLLGLPAIVSGLALVAVEPWHNRALPGEWARRYDQAGMSALRQGDLQAADVYFRRVAMLDESSPAACYGLALTAEQQKDLTRARGWMLRIASETEAGYAPAHFWLAKDLIRHKTPLDPQDARVLEHHLQQAARSPAHHVESRVNLTQLYMLRGETDKAIAQMELASAERPALQLDLAQLYELGGRKADARRAAAKAGDFFEARTLAEPRQAPLRQAWAASLALQERYEDAVRVLTAGLSQPDPKPFEQALAAVYLRWMNSNTATKKPNAAEQLEFLERILQHDAANEQALVMLDKLALGTDESAVGAAELLKKILARGAAPAVIHLVLGTRALAAGDVQAGLMHLEQAQERNAKIPEVMNNLAWGLTQKPEPDLERALQLAETAQKLSQHPETYDTVGTILAKLGRHREAVTQLETALRVLPPRAAIHRKLGDLYEQLGDADLAAEHRRLAEELKPPPPLDKPK